MIDNDDNDNIFYIYFNFLFLDRFEVISQIDAIIINNKHFSNNGTKAYTLTVCRVNNVLYFNCISCISAYRSLYD
jgi:hypothetical protein